VSPIVHRRTVYSRTVCSAVAALVAATAAVGCGVQPDGAPRDVPDANRARLGNVSVGSDAGGTERIYLVEPGENRQLRSVQRDLESGETVIDVLLRGPNPEERNQQYSSSIPATLRVVSTATRGSRLVLDVSQELKTLTGPGLVQALAQIVYTATEIDGIESVEITVEGDQLAWPTGDLDTTTEALRVYDYPALARTAQPAYPSVPSGGGAD
jgi:Sporulation and spore germination